MQPIDKLQITKIVRPRLLWQTNCKLTDLSDLAPYLQLFAFTKKTLAHKKSPSRAAKYSKTIPISEIHVLIIMHAAFPSLSHAQLTRYSIGDE